MIGVLFGLYGLGVTFAPSDSLCDTFPPGFIAVAVCFQARSAVEDPCCAAVPWPGSSWWLLRLAAMGGAQGQG